MDDLPSIFTQYYAAPPFVDRGAADPAGAVDVIIPVIHTNELWRANLLSIYREIPVSRLLIGDGGCIDGSTEIARAFPRCEVHDHRAFTSLGYSIRRLVEAVETEHFVYLHSDIFIPPGWFETMAARRDRYDWFECDQRITVMADYLFEAHKIQRAYSGSQFGRSAAMKQVVQGIDDDFLYRNEDIIIAHLTAKAGFRYGKVGEAFHFHQVMHKPSRWRRGIRSVRIESDLASDEEIRANDTYVRGIVRYMDRDHCSADLIESVHLGLARLIQLEVLTLEQFRDWVRQHNPSWLPEFTEATQPVLPPAPGAPPGPRDRTADRLIHLANIYRARGVAGVLRFVLRRLAGR